MKLLPHTAYRWPLVCFFVLSILCVATVPQLLVTAQQAGWQVEVEEGQKTSATLGITNRCLEPHLFRIKEDIKYLAFQEPTQSMLIGPGVRKSLAAIFDSTELKSQVYKDELTVECLDCKKEKASRCTQDRDKVPVQLTVTKPRPPINNTERIARPRLLFRWHGFEPRSPGCSAPLGLCLIIGFSIKYDPLTKAEIDEGYGTAKFQVNGNRLHMVFDREAALPNGTIPIDRDYNLKPDLSAELGYESIMLKKGVYKVDKSKEKFGEMFVDIVKGKPLPPTTAREIVNCYIYSNTTGRCKGCGVACDDGTSYPMACSADIFGDKYCGGGKYTVYNPDIYDKAEIFKNSFKILESFVLTQRSRGIVETFNALGTENSCSGSPGAGPDANINFTVVIPKLKKELKH